MKKQILFAGLILTSIFATGCGNSQEATITNLANQIDLLNNTINSVSYKTDIPSLSSLTKDQAKNYAGIYQSTKNIFNEQNTYKTAIKTKTAMIKDTIGKGKISLTRQNSKALVDLTKSLSKNTRSLNETKSEMNRSLTEVKKTINKDSSSISQVSAKVNRLSNCMDSQNCYYKNLLNTLLNIEKILDIEDSSFDFNSIINNTTDNKNEYSISDKEVMERVNLNATNEDSSKDLQELLYQYLLNNLVNNQTCPDCNNANNSDSNNIQTPNCPNGNCDTYNNLNNLPQQNCPTCPGNALIPQPVVNNPLNVNGNYNGYYGRGVVNPSRNTDTYRPWTTNIDTYRVTGNGYAGYNNNILTQPVLPASINSNEIQVNTERRHKRQEFAGKTNELRTIEINTSMKPKGHTQTLDVNKKIEELLNKDLKDTFNNSNNYISLR